MATLAGARQYGTYMTLDEVKSWLRYPTVSPGVDDTNMQRVVDMACTRIQNVINRPVGSQEFWERHDGWSGEYIMLKESPFLELVSCTEWQSSGGPITLAESTPENPVDGVQIDYSTGRLMRTFAGYSWPRPFFPGSRNIEVVYLAGFNPIPPDLWMATVELVRHWWENTQQAVAGRALGQANDPESRVSLFTSLPEFIEEMLTDYIKIGTA